MPAGNVEIARAAMEAFNRHDYDAGLSLFDPAVVWEVGREIQPDAGEFTGREGVKRFWDLWHDTFDNFELIIEECVEAPEGHVVATTRTHGFGAGSGAEVQGPAIVQLFQVRDGLITHVWMHVQRERALKAAGLSGGSS